MPSGNVRAYGVWALLVTSMFFILPAIPCCSGATVTVFSDGKTEKIMGFPLAGNDSSASVTIPNGTRVSRATVSITGEAYPPASEPDPYPASPAMSVCGTTVWKFEGPGYGPLGFQNTFTNLSGGNITVGPGISPVLSILLPAGASVKDAILNLSGINGTVSIEGNNGNRSAGPITTGGSNGISIEGLLVPTANVTATTDAWGNRLSRFNLTFSSQANGTLRINFVKVHYSATLTTNDFFAALNAALPASSAGPVTVNLTFQTASKGQLRVNNLQVETGPAGPNRPPEIESSPPPSAYVGYEYTYQVQANDPDGDALSYSLLSYPFGLVVDYRTGMVRWTPLLNQTGNASALLLVSDGRSETTQKIFVNVTQSAIPPPPLVRITSPREGERLNRSCYVLGVFESPAGAPPVSSVEVRVDTGPWAPSALGADSYQFLLDTSRYQNRPHKISVRAFDGYFHSPETSVNVSFDNPQYVLLNYTVSSDDAPMTCMAGFALLVTAVPLAMVVVHISRRRRVPGAPVPVARAPAPAPRAPVPAPRQASEMVEYQASAPSPPRPRQTDTARPTPEPRKRTIQCPACRNPFGIIRTAGPQSIRCPHCGRAGTIGKIG